MQMNQKMEKLNSFETVKADKNIREMAVKMQFKPIHEKSNQWAYRGMS
jgi:hypothetical protein